MDYLFPSFLSLFTHCEKVHATNTQETVLFDDEGVLRGRTFVLHGKGTQTYCTRQNSLAELNPLCIT
jgi:hypothetical protein